MKRKLFPLTLINVYQQLTILRIPTGINNRHVHSYTTMAIPVINFDKGAKTSRIVKMFPDVLRCGIFAPSSGGKTNVLLTMLVNVKPFWHIYLCSKTDFQEKYCTLKELINSYNNTSRGKKKPITFHKLTFPLPEPEEIEENSVIIFDDILTEKQDKIANFFLYGRHRGISCFMLSQSYTKVEKRSGIRSNYNFLILFRQDMTNLRTIYSEYVTDLTFDQFKMYCTKCWSKAYGFLTIDIDNNGMCKYREKFDKCL